MVTSATERSRVGSGELGGVDWQMMRLLVEEHKRQRRPRLERLWEYYRNDMAESEAAERGYRLSQEDGLPARLREGGISAARGGMRREVVVENDIAWRVHTLVDFMFGRPFALQSWAEDEARGRQIETFLKHVLEANGGISFFQDLALIGSVYGYVDIVLRFSGEGGAPSRTGEALARAGEAPPPGSHRPRKQELLTAGGGTANGGCWRRPKDSCWRLRSRRRPCRCSMRRTTGGWTVTCSITYRT